MNNFEKFGTALNCIDGRVQLPVADWVKLHCQVQYVDMITEPGIIKPLSNGNRQIINEIAENLRISIEAHQSKVVAVAGHFDCAANPVSFEEQEIQIREVFEMIKFWNLGVRIVGLFVNEWSAVDLICDTDAEFQIVKSFL